jgi:hypothetical protein
MQFALTEYICVSSSEEQDGCPPDDDIIHASAFHSETHVTDLHILSILSKLYFILDRKF